ncbi:MAG: hypothetical protein FWD25_12625 [Clostridia bacterium]|nr:hypothetical protein [Clostridia bacterium]
MSDVDLYIQNFNPEIQQRLLTIRRTALDIFESIDERKYYGLPAFFSNGHVVMFYGAYKNHISICVGDDWVDFLKYQYPQFRYTQFTILFQHKEPFPHDVVEVICELLKRGIQSKCSR